MENQAMNRVLQQVAGLHGVETDMVRDGIREAMAAAKQSENTVAGAFWKMMPDNATELDVVLCITRLLCAG